MYSVSDTIEAIAPADLKGAPEGVYIVENFPRMLKYKDDAFHKAYNALLGVDDVHARETGSDKVNAKSHPWQSYENLFALKQAIAASGWKQKSDDHGAEALEGLKMENSARFAQGAKVLRKEDHRAAIRAHEIDSQSATLRIRHHRGGGPSSPRLAVSARHRRWFRAAPGYADDAPFSQLD
jgi:branched-chain amino acid transport system substrate-binding protein